MYSAKNILLHLRNIVSENIERDLFKIMRVLLLVTILSKLS